MRIVTVFFDQQPQYRFFLNAFRESVHRNSTLPLQEVVVGKAKAKYGRSFKMTSNSHKLNIMNSIAQEANEDIVFMDCDMLVIKEIKGIFDLVSHFGITISDYPRLVPINGGVMVVKNTPEGKKQFQELTNINSLMMKNRSLHYRYRKTYAGMNQSAMGYLIEKGAIWDKLPMSEWNLCDPWHLYPYTRVIHYKSRLGICALENRKTYFPDLVALWQKYHNLALQNPQNANISQLTEIALDTPT